MRLVEAWSRNDAAGVANSFTEDGVMILPGDVFKKGRDEIHSFMAAAYAGPFKGTGVTGRPVDVGHLRRRRPDPHPRRHPRRRPDGNRGGVGRALHLGRRQRDGQWQLAGYQNSPRGAGATLRW